ncbi:MAG: hypothetical protein OES57_10900 [Acidimicrobiia bacterium]|nr:hypothetical protein [Acidimicrobiia bacterium]
MSGSRVWPGVGLVAAIVAIVSIVGPWGEDDRGTYYGLQLVGGTMFGALVVVFALGGLLIAAVGVTRGDRSVSTGRLCRSHLLAAAGAGVLGPALAFVLSPSVAYTSWKPAGIGGWLAVAMGVVMLVAGLWWARQQPAAPTAGISHDIDRSFGIGLLIAGVVAVVMPFFRWLQLEVDADTTFFYGALQDGLRGVGWVVLVAGALMVLAGVRIVQRYERDPLVTRGGIGAEHLGLLASAAGLSTALAFLLSIIRHDFDGTVNPSIALYLYLVAAFFGVYMTGSSLLLPGPRAGGDGDDDAVAADTEQPAAA